MAELITIENNRLMVSENGKPTLLYPLKPDSILQFRTSQSLPVANGHTLSNNHPNANRTLKPKRNGKSPALDHEHFVRVYLNLCTRKKTFKDLKAEFNGYSENCLRTHIYTYYEDCRRKKIEPQKLVSLRKW